MTHKRAWRGYFLQGKNSGVYMVKIKTNLLLAMQGRESRFKIWSKFIKMKMACVSEFYDCCLKQWFDFLKASQNIDIAAENWG